MVTSVETVEIVAEGTPTILVKDEKGTVNRLITDKQLKELEFDADGKLRRKSK